LVGSLYPGIFIGPITDECLEQIYFLRLEHYYVYYKFVNIVYILGIV